MARFSIFLLLFSVVTIFSQSHPNAKIDSLLKSGINKLFFQNYEGAKIVFTELDSLFSDNPLGNIYLAATEITMSVDYAAEMDETYLDSLIGSAKDKVDQLLDDDDENLWYNYYNALIYGYQAYYSSISGNLVSAFADGVLSLHRFQKCLEMDNNFNEAFIAIGTYKYWKSAQVKSFSWIPFIPDERDEGIELLEKSLKYYSYNQNFAAYSLAWIYIDNDKSEKTIALCENMLHKNQDSRLFKWALARAYQDIDKSKSIKVYSEILKSIESLPNNNHYYEIELKHKIAMLYYDLEENNKSLELCNQILDFKFKSAIIKQRLSNRIERVINLKSKIENSNN